METELLIVAANWAGVALGLVMGYVMWGSKGQARDEKEIERLKSVLHLDRSGLASALDECRNIAEKRLWIVDGRGAYSWDDDDYRREAGSALREIIDHCDAKLKESGDLAHAECCGRIADEGSIE